MYLYEKNKQISLQREHVCNLGETQQVKRVIQIIFTERGQESHNVNVEDSQCTRSWGKTPL